MRILIALSLLMTTCAFAQNLDATEALLQTLPAGDYRGLTLNNKACEVSVRNLSSRIAVVATFEGKTERTEVFTGAAYRWRPAMREFLSSVLTTTLRDRRENIVRTIATDYNQQYVVVGTIITSQSGTSESIVECIVNL